MAQVWNNFISLVRKLSAGGPKGSRSRQTLRISTRISAAALCGGVALIVAVCSLALGRTLNDLYQDAIDRSRLESGEFAAVLAGQTSRSVEAINIVLEEIARYALHKTRAELEGVSVYGLLRQKKAMLPAVDVISIAGEDGRILNLTRGWPAPAVNISDRDYFIAAKARQLDTLVIGEPASNRVTGATTVYFAQRIEDEHGTFLGTVNVGVSPERLLDAHAANAQVDGRALVLALRNGTVLAHSQTATAVGSRFPPTSPWHKAVSAGGGSYRSPGYFDSIKRIVAVQPLKNWPLVVNVSQQEEAALATWYHVRRSTFTYAGVALLGTLALALALVGNYRKLGQAQAKSWRWAHEDSLTALPNRRLLVDHLDGLLKAETVSPSAILFVDLDRFKAVNDSLGHAFGDEVLQQAAERLRAQFRPGDIVSRIGGDEFVVVVRDVEAQAAPEIAMRVVRELSQAYTLSEGIRVNIGASIGMRLFHSAQDPADKLIDDADRALYQAKQSGRGRYFIFDASLENAAKSKMLLDGRMRSALNAGEFELHYQPVVSLRDLRIVGCEALLRWRSPEHGLVMPGEFIPLAEETGFIEPLSRWVLEAAIEQMAKWKSMTLPIEFVAVNLCAPQFESPGFQQDLGDLMQRYQVEPGCLTLEITEGMAIQNQSDAQSRLRQLSDCGFEIALDDFGTGYSSLAILRRMPIHRLKIDRGFVKDLTVDPRADAIIQSIIDLARKLDLHVVAEGIETQAQLDLLRAAGCGFGQGYLLGRPVAADAFETLLRAPPALDNAA